MWVNLITATIVFFLGGLCLVGAGSETKTKEDERNNKIAFIIAVVLLTISNAAFFYCGKQSVTPVPIEKSKVEVK